jgi:probable addiction module antidote protein
MHRATRTTPLDAADYLTSDSRIESYLNAVLEEGDPGAFAQALGTVARARGMAHVAKGARMGRESLYKALSTTGNPAFASVVKVASALGFDLKLKRKPRADRATPNARHRPDSR